MLIEYKLSSAEKSSRGVLQNTTPLILDKNQTCEIFFYLVSGKSLTTDYYVTIFDGCNQQIKLQVTDSKITLPQSLWREQELMLTVDFIDSGKVAKTWHCQPLKLAFKDSLDKATLTIGQDLYGLIERIASLENEAMTAQQESERLQAVITAQAEQIKNLNERLTVIENKNTSIIGL